MKKSKFSLFILLSLVFVHSVLYPPCHEKLRDADGVSGVIAGQPLHQLSRRGKSSGSDLSEMYLGRYFVGCMVKGG